MASPLIDGPLNLPAGGPWIAPSPRHDRARLGCWRTFAICAVLATAACGERYAAAAAEPLGQEPSAAVLRTDSAPSTANEASGEPLHDAHAGDGAGHADPVAPVLLAIIIVLLLAKIGGDLFERISMPAVLGELIVGVLLGNMALMSGWHGLDFLKAPQDDALRGAISKLEHPGTAELTSPERELLSDAGQQSFYQAGAILKMLASLGVILLLFEVGLESSVGGMMSVGVSSMLVAMLGVIAPMVLGYGASWIFLREEGWQVHAFIGATLCATSVGITARVLKDLGRSQQRESQIILGAAVIDDVLGLMVLAVVSGVIQQGANFDPASLLGIVGKSLGFLLGAILLGNLITRPLYAAATILNGHGLLVVTSLVICFGFAWLANLVGLAPIVGAFAAGLILEHAHYQELGRRENIELEEALRPLSAVLVPIFFVQMGIMVDLSSFRDPSVWGLAAAITVMAIIGKQACAWGVTERGLNRLAVGLGMIPRGEVGLIFAAEGAKLKVAGEPVVSPGTYSAIVVMVMLTTLVTPPVLKWRSCAAISATEQVQLTILGRPYDRCDLRDLRDLRFEI